MNPRTRSALAGFTVTTSALAGFLAGRRFTRGSSDHAGILSTKQDDDEDVVAATSKPERENPDENEEGGDKGGSMGGYWTRYERFQPVYVVSLEIAPTGKARQKPG